MKKLPIPRYTDIDYEAFLKPDFESEKHWILLPVAVWREKIKAREAALHAERIAAQPPDHKVILVPADIDYASKEEELWPIINHAVLEAIQPHQEIKTIVWQAIGKAVSDFRGWSNPYPATLEYPDRPISTQAK